MSTNGIPGIPLAALDAVSDQNVRLVLQAIVDGWMVRNGITGNTASRFVTQKEFDEIAGRVNGSQKKLLLGDASVTQKAAATVYGQSDETVADMIAKVEQAILSSTFASELGDRLGDIDLSLGNEVIARTNADNAITTSVTTQFNTVNTSLAAVQTQTTTNTSSISALSSTVTSLQSTVAGHTSSIAQEISTRAYQTGDLYAKYTVKIDQYGHVSGFGLASEANNGSVTSAFIIRADRFAIVDPSDTGNSLTTAPAAASLPFAVEGGVTYIKNAAIKDAAIDNAKIASLAVGTTNLQANSVSEVYFGKISTESALTSVAGYQIYLPNINVSNSGRLVIQCVITCHNFSSSSAVDIQILTFANNESEALNLPILRGIASGANSAFMTISPRDLTSGNSVQLTTAHDLSVTAGQTVPLFIDIQPSGNNTTLYLVDAYYIATLYKK